MGKRFVYRQKNDFYFITSIGNQTEDLYLSCLGRKANVSEYRYGPAVRSYDLIHVIIRGKGTLLMNHAEYQISEGQAFFIPRGMTADYYADVYEPWEYLWFGYNGSIASLFDEQVGLSVDSPICQLHGKTELFEAMMDEILPYTTVKLCDELYRIGWLYRMLALFTDASNITPGTVTPSVPKISNENILEHAVSYISQHYDTVTVTALAEHLQIGRSHLYKVFKASHGISPQCYLMDLRFEHALELLQSSNCPIKQIAEETGFRDASNFSRQFQKRMGVSPRTYQKNTKGGFSHGTGPILY